MSRPLRIEFPGAVYHVTSRGDRREAIYRDDADRLAQLEVLAQAIDRFDPTVLAYCLMGNHYHLVLHTREPNLSRLMRHVNGVYTQHFNRRHALVGHVFQGRFKAILVDRDAYLLALCRCVERNPWPRSWQLQQPTDSGRATGPTCASRPGPSGRTVMACTATLARQAGGPRPRPPPRGSALRGSGRPGERQ